MTVWKHSFVVFLADDNFTNSACYLLYEYICILALTTQT